MDKSTNGRRRTVDLGVETADGVGVGVGGCAWPVIEEVLGRGGDL